MPQNFWQKAQALDRRVIYTVLIVACIIGLFIPVEVPNEKPDRGSIDVYRQLMSFPKNKTLLVQTDWTNSTRGENAGHLEALIKILIKKRQRFVFYSLGDPQAPQVARDVLASINDALPKEQRLQKGVDYLDLGFFPNAEGTTQAMGVNLRDVWKGRTATMPDGTEKDIFETDVLKSVKRIEDVAAVLYITASSTIDVGIQRLSKKVPLVLMCTGVVGPQMLPYYRSGQLKGIAIGLKGGYDMETVMAYGVNYAKDGKEPKVSIPEIDQEIPPLEGYKHNGRAKKYIASLNVALALMIFAILFGNFAMYMAKKTAGGAE